MVSEKKMRKVAKNIVHTNFSISKGDVVNITAGPNSLDFAEALAYECSIVGAQPFIMYGSDKLSMDIYKDIDPKFLKQKPKLGYNHLKVVDAEMHIDDSNPYIARKMPQWKVEIRRKTVKPLRKLREKKLWKKTLRSALIGFPTKEKAKMMGLPYTRLDKIFWDTMDVDFERLYRFNERLMKKVKNAKTVHIVGKKTDLTFSVKGREFLNDSGIVAREKMGFMNLPAGEIFVAPIEDSANGEIFFDLPCLYHYGKQVHGVWFKFRKGKVIEYKITKGKKNFEDIIKNASGAKTTIAELGIGTNYRAKPTGGMIIVDEKVYGTIHIAIGSNELFGGKSESTIHWDFFKSMDRGSRVEIDGKVLMKDGKWKV